MKAFAAAILLLGLSVIALAKPSPVERASLAFMNADINIGLVGDEKVEAAALREHDYFFAPVPAFNAGALPCRLKEVLFHKTRLAQICP